MLEFQDKDGKAVFIDAAVISAVTPSVIDGCVVLDTLAARGNPRFVWTVKGDSKEIGERIVAAQAEAKGDGRCVAHLAEFLAACFRGVAK